MKHLNLCLLLLLITKREKKKIELLKERKQTVVTCFQFILHLVELRFTNGLLGYLKCVISGTTW